MNVASNELRVYKDKDTFTGAVTYQADVRIKLYMLNDMHVTDNEIALMIKDHMRDFVNNIDTHIVCALCK